MGVVTTTRVQHASPAGTYAHTVNRNWYSDADMPARALKEGCRDIARQLISNMDIDVRQEGPRGPGRRGGPLTGHSPRQPTVGALGPAGCLCFGVVEGTMIWDTPQTWWGTRGLSERGQGVGEAKGLPGPKPTGPHAPAQVILGGGRRYMFPKGTPDPEYPDDAAQSGIRLDSRNLVQEWQAKHQVMGAPGCRGRRDKGRAAAQENVVG